MNTQNYLKVLEEAIEDMKGLKYIWYYFLFLQIEALEFYYENNIKIIY